MYDPSEVPWDYPPKDRRTGMVPVPIGTSCRFHLYDAGMTGLYLSMLDSLSNIATVLNRTNDAIELRQRHTKMAAKLNDWLWNDTMGIYTNVQSRGAKHSSARISPFNFHAMLTGAANTTQAELMVSKWLLSDHGFCLVDHSNESIVAGDAIQGVTPSLMPNVSCNSACNSQFAKNVDAKQPAQQVAAPQHHVTASECCATCDQTSRCDAFVLGGSPDKNGNYDSCWLLTNVTEIISATGRSLGCVRGRAPIPIAPIPPPPSPPKSLGCKFGVPSISHGDPAYQDQSCKELHCLHYDQ